MIVVIYACECTYVYIARHIYSSLAMHAHLATSYFQPKHNHALFKEQQLATFLLRSPGAPS